ncbi:MAG: hypothetical protein LDL31_11255 [Prosthecobacter sp.]|nr:hypothetical protein [Prosthecobacter sp.]
MHAAASVHPLFPPAGQIGPAHTAAMDWFVLINLAFLMFMLGFFACWAWLLWRRCTRPAPHLQLLMELEEELAEEKAHPQGTDGPAEPRAEWERAPDWWRK